MVSYRTGLAKVGITKTAAVSYRAFSSRPKSLRQAIRSMDAPTTQQWSQVSDTFRDDYWTDEVQGVACDGKHWIFSANANQSKVGHNDKAIYVFKRGRTLADGNWVSMVKYKNVPHPVPGTTENDDHWGQVTYFEGFVYVAHFWKDSHPKDTANVIVFKDTNGVLEFKEWIELEKPTSSDGRHAKAEFQAINPWNGMFYTCFGSGEIRELFMHDRSSGTWTGQTLELRPPVEKVQGACFSPNGHLYIATNDTLPGDSRYQTIWYYSALNGHRFGAIPVLAEEGMPDQELEGNCYADVTVPGGKRAQIHVVLLEGGGVLGLDNIFFKSFASTRPDLV
ncbi:MAG: hypothetical protein ACRD2X_28025 [Vicinamibacteraceae bacterium]